MIEYCEHIYVYYKSLWLVRPNLYNSLFRKGYYQASRGIWLQENNLFEVD